MSTLTMSQQFVRTAILEGLPHLRFFYQSGFATSTARSHVSEDNGQSGPREEQLSTATVPLRPILNLRLSYRLPLHAQSKAAADSDQSWKTNPQVQVAAQSIYEKLRYVD